MLGRGKDTGHDIDLLISHPEEGKEEGLLQRLISVLESRGVVLQGRWERSTFSADDCTNEAVMSRPSNVKNTLDHFEKWIGIMKLDAGLSSDRNCAPADTEVSDSVHGKCVPDVQKICIHFCCVLKCPYFYDGAFDPRFIWCADSLCR